MFTNCYCEGVRVDFVLSHNKLWIKCIFLTVLFCLGRKLFGILSGNISTVRQNCEFVILSMNTSRDVT